MSINNTSVAEFLRANQLTGETRLYRYSLPEFLRPTDDPAFVEISANEDPSEAVVSVYDQGHTGLAVHIGAGLSFAESADNEWCSAERTCVELRLQDVLDQGGRIYPVESITTERTWYVTLPQGTIRVRKVAAGLSV